jgi:uncharacterized repeat protein (TIGR03803 family)
MCIKRSAISVLLLAAFWLCGSGPQTVAQTESVGVPGTTLTTLHSFTGTDGNKSFAGLVQGKNGNLYGTTYFGGAKNDGEVFQITAAGKLTTLHSFCSTSGCADGEYSYAVPVLGVDGNFYGTTYLGGSKGDGTVFKMGPSGALTTLHSFGGADGSQPLAGLAAGSDGNFYGTTNLGGSHNAGSVFKVTTSGQFTTLHSFCSKAACADGQSSYAGLIQATDGNLYGTTLSGGSHGHGTVFKVTEGGIFSTLYSFCSQNGCADGEFPQTGLVQASNGNLYGTTILGGAYGSGTIFELTLSGALTTLYSACSQSGCPDGNYLYAPLIQAKDGNLYGIMQIGGAHNSGTIFQITLTGTLTTLYSFCSQPACADGQYPAAGLVQASNGNLYGTTADGGAHGDGTVFSIAP